MYSFNELSESQKLTAEEKKTAKQILGLLNGQNQVAAKQMLDFCYSTGEMERGENNGSKARSIH